MFKTCHLARKLPEQMLMNLPLFTSASAKDRRGAEKGALYNLFSVKSPAQDQVFNFEDKMKKNRISFGGMKHFLAIADPS